MQKVLTAEQMREVDRLTTEKYGISSIILMENAAHAVASVITEKLGGSVKDKVIIILCGPGNNGGDGAALARILWEQGGDCFAKIFGKIEETKGDARLNFEILERISNSDDANAPNDNCLFVREIGDDESVGFVGGRPIECVVDALFGTGLSRPLDGKFQKVVRDIAFHKRHLNNTLFVSVDLPSGLDADRPELIGDTVKPDVTVTFTSPKPATVMPPTSDIHGELRIVSIGTPPGLVEAQPSMFYLAERADARRWLHETRFTNTSYKNKRGHALVVAGSESYSGAAVLAGDAAMRSGVGLVTVVTPKSSKDSVSSRVLPEVMVRGVAETDGGAISEAAFNENSDVWGKADSIAIGCGLSQDESTREFVKKVVENRGQPTIIDADALNLLSPFAGFAANGESQFPLILTPHEGEFMRLLGTDDKDAIKDRVAAVREFSVKNNVILVLKGERVLIGEPGGKVVVNPTGNSGLGKAGNGDTLTGILAGFVAQAVVMNIDIFETVVAAVYFAGMAGDIAKKKYGERVMTASDVRECLVDAFQQLTTKA